MIQYLRLLITCVAASFSVDAISAVDSCSRSSAHKVEAIFAEAIVLNQSFQKSAQNSDTNDEKYRVLRKRSEQNYEGKLMPCIKRATQLLSKDTNIKLMQKLMQLVVSFENTADETLSYSMGKVFAANPQIIEVSMKKFSDSERRVIATSVQLGWTNVRPGLAPTLVKDRDMRVKNLLLL